jgi:hypothetical protein
MNYQSVAVLLTIFFHSFNKSIMRIIGFISEYVFSFMKTHDIERRTDFVSDCHTVEYPEKYLIFALWKVIKI